MDSDLKKRSTKPRSDRPKAERFNDMQFIQYELDKDQQKACKDHAVTADELFDEMLALLSDGYKLSIRYDWYSECYAAYMQTTEGTAKNAGFILSGRGSTPFKAFKQLVYKHRVCLDGEWSGYAERRGGFNIDD